MEELRKLLGFKVSLEIRIRCIGCGVDFLFAVEGIGKTLKLIK